MYSHLRIINNLFEIILLKYNVIGFFMIFKITGHVYDINIQTATAFSSESYRLPYTIVFCRHYRNMRHEIMTEWQRRNACLRNIMTEWERRNAVWERLILD